MNADGRNRSDRSNPSFSRTPFACFSDHSPTAIVLATRALRYWNGSAGPSHRLHHWAGTSWRRREVAKEYTAADISEEFLRTLLRADNWLWMAWVGTEAEEQYIHQHAIYCNRWTYWQCDPMWQLLCIGVTCTVSLMNYYSSCSNGHEPEFWIVVLATPRY